MKHYSIANRDRSFTVRYKDEDENLVEACVAAHSITEAISILREFVQFVRSHPNSIVAVIEGCNE